VDVSRLVGSLQHLCISIMLLNRVIWLMTLLTIRFFIFTTMDSGMTSRRKYDNILIKVKKHWEIPTGHKEHRDTVMDNRPKRLRTRSAIDKSWRKEYDM